MCDGRYHVNHGKKHVEFIYDSWKTIGLITIRF